MTRNHNLDRQELIYALNKEFYEEKPFIPFVEQSKYIKSTGSLDCNLLNVDRTILTNLKEYTVQIQKSLETASSTDFSKAQSAMYAKLAAKCVDYVLEEQLKVKNK